MLGRPIKWEDLVEDNVSGARQSPTKDLAVYPMLAASYFDELRQDVHALRERLDSAHERLDVRLNQQHESINEVVAGLRARLESLSEDQAMLARGLIWLAENLDLTQDFFQKHPYLHSLAKQVGKRKGHH
jgi:aromatic ring-cleaving dioxygenase